MTIDAAALPRTELAAGTPLYRIHRAASGAWYFDASADGRFNPCAIPARGACYWATDPLGAFVETFRTMRTIVEDDIDARALSTIQLIDAATVVDLTDRKGLAVGVTGALVSGTDYDEPQQLASDVQRTVDGVIWHARHDLAAELVCVALFGDEGAPTGPALANLPKPKTEPIPAALIDRAEDEFGYLVLPTPV